MTTQPEASSQSAAFPPIRETFRKLTKFYIPLAIQGMSMSLTYPLVASIVSHGKLGASEYAVFAQSQAIMFFVGSVGAGMITTGMIFARSLTGYRNYFKLSILLGCVAALLQFLCCVPPFDNIVFGKLYHLDGELFDIGKKTLLCAIPMNFTFFARNPFLSTLFAEKRSDKATLATFVRIGMTWLGSVIFVKLGLTGWMWGLGLTTVAVITESQLFKYFASPYIKSLDDAPNKEKASISRQLAFTLPLSLGGSLMTISGVMIGIFLGKAPDPGVSREVHYMAMGIMAPLGGAAARMQSVTVAFPPSKYGSRAITLFTLCVGITMCSISLILQIPQISRWYFVDVQNLAPELVRNAKIVMLIYCTGPFLHAIRSNSEGIAALRRRPNATLSGQATYLATLVIVFFLLVHFAPIGGYMMGAISVLSALIASYLALRIALIYNDLADNYEIPNMPRQNGRDGHH